MTTEFKVKFHEHGFEVGKDISEGDYEKACAEFMSLYDMFARMSNESLERINEIWEKFEYIKASGDFAATMMCALTMGIGLNWEGYSYNDWIEKWYKEIVQGVDAAAKFSGFRMRSNIFRDGDMPVYGAKFIDHPEWTMDFTLEQMN